MRELSWVRQVARRTFVTFVALITMVFVVGVLSRWYVESKIHRVTVAGLTGAGSGTQNILLVGSTDRCGLKQQNDAFGLCSQGVTGVNSDVVMILDLDAARHQASILSIPRDTFVPNARSSGGYKIDAALYEGPSQLVRAIEDDFAIPITHYVELNFDGSKEWSTQSVAARCTSPKRCTTTSPGSTYAPRDVTP